MNRNLFAKISGGLGLLALGVLYSITSSGSFEEKMLALSPENSDLTSTIMVSVLAVSVVLLLTAKILYKAPEPEVQKMEK